MLQDIRRPTILIIYNDRDSSLAARFISELNLLDESRIVRITPWFIRDSLADQPENQRRLTDRLETATVVLTLASRNLLNSVYYQRILRPLLREYRNNESMRFFSIILSPLNLDETVMMRDITSGENFLFPSDGKSVFAGHLPEEMEGVFAEVVETVFSELIVIFYRPSGIRAAQKDKVFISYSRADYKIANLMRAFLAGQGYNVWLDKYSLKGGQNWVNAVDDAIRNSWALVLLISHASRVSEYVNYEWSFGFGANTCIVPIMIENVNLHQRLSWINCLNWCHLTVDQYLWDELIDALQIAKLNASSGKCNA